MNRHRAWWQPALAGGLTLSALLSVLAGGGTSSERYISLDLTADRPGQLQIYFDRGSGFSEEDSSRIDFPAGSSNQSISLTDAGIDALRLDPGPPDTQIGIREIAVEDLRSGQRTELSLHGLIPLNEIDSIDRTDGAVKVRVTPEARDPQLLLPVHVQEVPRTWRARIINVGQWFLLAAIGTLVVVWLAQPKAGVPTSAMLLGAWLLIAAMAFASVTSRSIHPDENSHTQAARYYMSHLVPPAADSTEIVSSYSVYGGSYLNEYDVVYLLAAKATQLWSGFGLHEVISLRLFNVALFGILLLVAWRYPDVRPAMIVPLLTPQIWYVFSYFNADAFALFLSLVAVMLSASPHSAVSRFIEGGRGYRIALCVFVIALGLLLVSKRNYLPVVLVIALILAMRHLQVTLATALLAIVGAALLLFRGIAGNEVIYMFSGLARYFAPLGLAALGVSFVLALRPMLHRSDLRRRSYRIATIFILSLAVASPRIIADVIVNGSPAEKALKMYNAVEQYADVPFKRSTLATDPQASYPGLALAAKGATLLEIVGAPYEWLTSSWRSLLGVYGYMNVFAPPPMYIYLGAALAGLCFSAVGWAFLHADARTGLVIVVSGIALVALSSIINSWANDLQGQGRYLFPALAMLAAYLQSQPNLSTWRPTSFAIAACYVGSVVSFVTVAFPALVR